MMPSDVFEEVVRSCSMSSSVRTTCELCDREHFAINELGCWEVGEMEELRLRSKMNPDKCVAWDSMVPTATIGGKDVVVGCQCDGLQRYEDFIWTHRHLICKYLVARADDVFGSTLEDLRDSVLAGYVIELLSKFTNVGIGRVEVSERRKVEGE